MMLKRIKSRDIEHCYDIHHLVIANCVRLGQVNKSIIYDDMTVGASKMLLLLLLAV